jgi:hypothetical protein
LPVHIVPKNEWLIRRNEAGGTAGNSDAHAELAESFDKQANLIQTSQVRAFDVPWANVDLNLRHVNAASLQSFREVSGCPEKLLTSDAPALRAFKLNREEQIKPCPFLRRNWARAFRLKDVLEDRGDAPFQAS